MVSGSPRASISNSGVTLSQTGASSPKRSEEESLAFQDRESDFLPPGYGVSNPNGGRREIPSGSVIGRVLQSTQSALFEATVTGKYSLDLLQRKLGLAREAQTASSSSKNDRSSSNSEEGLSIKKKPLSVGNPFETTTRTRSLSAKSSFEELVTTNLQSPSASSSEVNLPEMTLGTMASDAVKALRDVIDTIHK